MKRIVASLISLFLATGLIFAQGSGTPNTLRVLVDANGYLAVAGATQTAPTTSCVFNNCRLQTDANGYLQVVLTGGAITGQLLASDGTVAAPSYSFAADTDTGFRRVNSNYVSLVLGGADAVTFQAAQFTLGNSIPLAWSSGDPTAIGPDVILRRDAAGILADRDGTNAQQFNIYNTYTSSTNNELFSVDWKTTANQTRIGTFKGSGGGTVRPWTMIWPGTTPGTLLNGDTWIDTAAGNFTTTATTISLKAQNNSVTRTIASITF